MKTSIKTFICKVSSSYTLLRFLSLYMMISLNPCLLWH
nr:MAG TPA: hypothetical protein [Caudoviricetes sp.]